ncbi:hypothetical protein SCLCIDRAFT_25372 [Scleroderma citrinum Foug A]|uniref:Uncharacterized protein n=1 Tax=Scleroderma citrinum Foug A TaxID=1036808 RepID=A0A0C3DML0_9AGAM|nr:hypothetical protein SCLCIDRAFT_25372 [Scleroderma citrinum Foug A]
MPSVEVDQLNFETSSIFALLWNLCRTHLPPEVILDVDEFLDRENMARMGGGMERGADGKVPATGKYVIGVGVDEDLDQPTTFHEVEMSPPSGVAALNYCHAGHTEQQPHKYAFSWTTCQTGGPEKGGLFYISNFGICIAPASNTLVVWQPRHVHGTSLQDRQVNNDPDSSQAGIAIVTPSQLPNVWHKYWDKKWSHEMAAAEIYDHQFDDEDDST